MRARTKDADFAPELVRVPGGEFLMGSAEREGLCDERPQHRVEIGYALLIGKYPVTFAEWDYYYEVAGRFEDGRDNPERAAVNAETAHPRYPCDEGWGRGRRPVINVSWYDAQDYLAWLSRETGRAYRLLSEAAWEYACRAGTQTAYGFGDIASSTLAHVDCSVPEEENDAFDRKTCEVGRYPANLFGLHDMHGNVAEWCEDAWADSYLNAPIDGSARTEAGDDTMRVIRGGSWDQRASAARSASRSCTYPDNRFFDLGFRVARVADT